MIVTNPMPTEGYATIGLKPAIFAKLQKLTDEYYPGMILPSALIIIMNEIICIFNIAIRISIKY